MSQNIRRPGRAASTGVPRLTVCAGSLTNERTRHRVGIDLPCPGTRCRLKKPIGYRHRPPQLSASRKPMLRPKVATATATVGPKDDRQSQRQNDDQRPGKRIQLNRRMVLVAPATTAKADFLFFHPSMPGFMNLRSMLSSFHYFHGAYPFRFAFGHSLPYEGLDVPPRHALIPSVPRGG